MSPAFRPMRSFTYLARNVWLWSGSVGYLWNRPVLIETNGNVMCNSWGHFYWHGLTVITTWISNYVHYTVWVKLRIHYQTTRVQLLNWSIFHQRLYWTCDYLSMLGLKLVHVSKWASGYIVMHHFAFKYTCIAEILITSETLSSSFALYEGNPRSPLDSP